MKNMKSIKMKKINAIKMNTTTGSIKSIAYAVAIALLIAMTPGAAFANAECEDDKDVFSDTEQPITIVDDTDDLDYFSDTEQPITIVDDTGDANEDNESTGADNERTGANCKPLNRPKVSIKAGKHMLIIKHMKVGAAAGFQISYRKAGQSNWKTRSFNTTKSVNKTLRLTKGSYKVKIRAYQNTAAGIVYSSWTGTKSIKVK